MHRLEEYKLDQTQKDFFSGEVLIKHAVTRPCEREVVYTKDISFCNSKMPRMMIHFTFMA